MNRLLVAFVLVVVFAGVAHAAPGDPRVLQGVLEWPRSFSTEPFVVIRGEDGHLYYADLGSAQRRAPGALTAGSRVTVVGIEGNRPYEVAAMVIGIGDAASLGLPPGSATPSSTSTAAEPATTLPAAPSEPMWRLDGTVQSVAGKIVTLRTAQGGTSTVDLSQLGESTVRSLRAGDQVSLFGVPRDDRRLVASGYVQHEPVPPSASPRSTR
jgi:hypothetical protein